MNGATNPLSQRGRVALVTGAAGCIGRAIAVALAAQGARVIATDRAEGAQFWTPAPLARAAGARWP